MRHLGWKLAIGIATTFFCLAAPPSSMAVPYYTATYVGESGAVWYSDGVVTNKATGATFPYAPTTYVSVDSQPAGYFDGLPTKQVDQGSFIKIPTTYQMRPEEMNGSGLVVGTIPNAPGYNPWVYQALVYTVRQADGSFGGSGMLADEHESYYGLPQLSDTNQILINRVHAGWNLYDVKTRVETSIGNLIPPDLLAKYGLTRNDVPAYGATVSIDGRGDLMVDLPKGDGSGQDVYILTPPGLAAPAPVPEPSVLWIAAAAVAGLGFRARRRRDG